MTLSKTFERGLYLFLLVLLQRSLCIFPKEDPQPAARARTVSDPELIRTTQCEKIDKQCDPVTNECKYIRGVETCPPTTSSASRVQCYATWTNGSEGVHYVKMGCWLNENSCNGQRQCVQKPPVRHIYFCCCESDFCNRNITFAGSSVLTSDGGGGDATTPLPSDWVRKNDESQWKTLVWAIVPIIGIAVIGIFLFFIWKHHRRGLYTGHQQLPTIEPGYICTPTRASLNLDKVELIEVRARGRFGCVWKAQLLNEYVAVKVFPLQDKQSWMTEQEIYNLPQMSHNNILRFIASEKRGENLETDLWLVTEFQELGSLYDYLKAHVLTWQQLCKIAETMATGLAFLHDEIPATATQASKPAIAHRDFKSKNVLLKTDLSACIADFGLALKFESGKGSGETHGLVGTRRYMAPEVLEGAICFNRDAFQRIDMYACGLVIWELLSRCNAAEGPVSDYELPFESAPEVGQHPSLETMQEYVVTRKMRPPIYDYWRKHTGMSTLVLSVEECWDQDAEARLSASCLQERIATMTYSAGGMPPPPPPMAPLPSSLPSQGQGLPHSGDSIISISTSSDIPPKDLSSC